MRSIPYNYYAAYAEPTKDFLGLHIFLLLFTTHKNIMTTNSNFFTSTVFKFLKKFITRLTEYNNNM